MYRVTKNIFSGGRNTDTDPTYLQPNQYIEAHNVELVGDSNFMALKNIKGTTNLKTILSSASIEVLGVFANKYLISGTLKNCLTIFTATPSDKLKYWCYDTEGNQLYELFEQTIGSDYLTQDRVVDAVNYPENGVDIIYFTDFYHEVRYIKCEIPSPYTANFLSSYEIALFRKGAVGTVALSSISTGGTLLTGTYQFSYRMVDPTGKSFTKWSTLTNPIHVYDKANSTTPVHAGVGLISDRKITLSITPSTPETTNYDFIQLAVVENVGPTTPTTASLLEITSIPGTSLTFDYKANTRIGTIPLTDITVDLAQIETVKTLSIKENRLVGGNIKYTELDFDNGTPSISSGQIISNRDSTDSFASDLFSSKYVGYFRGEVYRIGIVYEDANGNKSTVQPLDMSSITGNAITFGLKDLKFPSRSSSPDYSIWYPTGQLNSLGVRLTGLVNHPTWASSLEIVRVKRLKDILFQSPIIPMSSVQGVGAQSEYPTSYSNGSTQISVDNAQPQTAGSTLIPKNLFWPERREINGNRQSSGSGFTYKAIGEATLVPNNAYAYACIFPSGNMYSDLDNQFIYTGAEKIDFIDYALLKLTSQSMSSTPSVASSLGNFYKTNIVGNFNAISEGQYYFDSTNVKSPISSAYQNLSITDYEYFDNLGSPGTVAGASTMDYPALQTTGVSFWQTPPKIQRMGVVKISGSLLEELTSKTFKAAVFNAPVGGNFVTGSSGIKYESPNTITNTYVTDYAGYSSSSYVSYVGIVNVKLGLSDDRYGDLYSQHEYISTGAKYTFTSSEVATLRAGGSVSVNIDVWGGDCFVTSHLFKVSDSTYSVINQTKNNTPPNTEPGTSVLSRWGAVYAYNLGGSTNPIICIPVAVEACAQYIQVCLESEYNGDVRDVDNLFYVSGAIPIYYNNNKESLRSPLTYKYNINLSRGNTQKVFFPKLQYSFEQNDFISRIVYSDVKLYNSAEAGFDVFRVSNLYDIEEKRFGITKLAVASDELYAIQERGIVYIPTGTRQIESTDGGTLAVRTGDFINRPVIIDAVRGSRHLRGIVETGNSIYIPDNENKSVYVLSGNQLQSITQNNESRFRTIFANSVNEKNVIGIYNPERREYWLCNTQSNECEVYNESVGWISTYDIVGFQGGVSTNQKIYLLGRPSSSLAVYSAYTSNDNVFFGTQVSPSVTFYVNPDESISKMFTNMMIDCGGELDNVSFITDTQEKLSMSIISAPRLEGNYRIQIPYDDNTTAKFRGLLMKVIIRWRADVSGPKVLKSVGTKYKLNRRTPW